jgi:hypothetical protein
MQDGQIAIRQEESFPVSGKEFTQRVLNYVGVGCWKAAFTHAKARATRGGSLEREMLSLLQSTRPARRRNRTPLLCDAW